MLIVVGAQPGPIEAEDPQVEIRRLAGHRLRQQFPRQRTGEIAEHMPGVHRQSVDARNRPDDRQRVRRLRQQAGPDQIGRASCRERVYVLV